jgi:arginase
MIKSIEIPTFGYASGLGAENPDCYRGPKSFQQSISLTPLANRLQWHWLHTVQDVRGLAAMPHIAKACKQLALQVYTSVQQKKFFLTLGGDHSCAIGTWSGAAAAIAPQSLGLIWIDAHLDSHTPETSHTKNIHGMPLATLLGHGDHLLTQILLSSPKLQPENVCVIGARNYEVEEQKLLETLNVRIFHMEEIKQRSLETVFQEALILVKKNTQAYGISIDLDAIDPSETPGVGTPEPDGIHSQSLCACLSRITNDSAFIGAEIVEFNPTLDREQKTEKVIQQLLAATLTGEL